MRGRNLWKKPQLRSCLGKGHHTKVPCASTQGKPAIRDWNKTACCHGGGIMINTGRKTPPLRPRTVQTKGQSQLILDQGHSGRYWVGRVWVLSLGQSCSAIQNTTEFDASWVLYLYRSGVCLCPHLHMMRQVGLPTSGTSCSSKPVVFKWTCLAEKFTKSLRCIVRS